ncbi:MAG: TetR/AcrR family transcriptional regulator [Zunongwangia sp.]|jgi:AcrR family transcriptional regulator|uniref:TetR family transcriptional regulator n=2 Tax=Zunongwangia profunda TaxID=398743 RepID=D5BDF0_ZUNPS|nr:TetR family transcriptional regulator [Zunongwangia profunda SM-A87]MAC65595.1 TetR/AcrR family transcriptional regulator [Flavobacteriaceae bacterium]MAO37702.1 TetR/AcrR family transcriptional regulator [Zunongwangia sp.]MAS71698.1 TetR/AcrR family transcriptional regulator [Zunongwangia sp.]|tara:strand:+ start:5298 stop:5891 length:594 start_codon:yes stop_codon:yes gene_type:complete
MATEMFLEYGFKSVTMDDIAEKLGISKKTIYANYATKTLLVQDVAFNILETIQKSIAEIKKKDLNAIEELFEVKKQIRIFLKDEKTSPQFQLEKYYPKIFANVTRKKSDLVSCSIEENVTRGINEGLFRKEIDVKFIAKLYHEGTNAIRDTSIFPAENYSKADLFQLYIEYHVRGIATKKGLEILEDLLNNNETSTH